MTTITRIHAKTFALIFLLFLLVTAFVILTAPESSADLTGVPLELPEPQLNIITITEHVA